MYFFANSYVSGLARLAHGSTNIGMVSSAEKDFNPKTDTMLFDSFFGTPSNVDAREFADAEQKILNIQKRLKTMEEYQPEQYAKYVEKNPMHPFIVESYNVKVNQVLRDLRKEANVYRRMPGLTPKERTDIVKNYVSMQNLVKRDILNTLEAYGLED
jgi:spermidine/putrescine-binding protein